MMHKRILIVDDEKPTLEMLEMLLEGYGYEVLLAENGEQALAIYEKERPPIVLTDIKMPLLDGMEVLDRIKRANPKAEVIVVTGHGDVDQAVKALDLEATDFISKPVRRKVLDLALQRAENRIRMSDNIQDLVTEELRPEGAVITNLGSLTAASGPFLQKAFERAMEEAGRPIFLCFGPNSSVNGAGISLLTLLFTRCQETRTPVALVGVQDNLREVLEIVGVGKLVEIYPTLDEAVQAVARV